MKIIIAFIISLLTINLIYPQDADVESKTLRNIPAIDQATMVGLGMSSGFDFRSKKVKGHPFLFDSFKNESVFFIKEKGYRINNFNIKLDENVFVSSLSKDEILIIRDVEKAIIDNKRFEKIKGKFYEILYQVNNDFKLLKLYKKKLLGEVYNKMSNQLVRPKRWVLEYEYCTFKTGSVDEIRLNKKSIINALDKSKEKLIRKFVKEKDLSFKKEKDIIKILNYYNTL